MSRRLADLVGLREGEGGRTGRLAAFIFLITAAIVLLKGAQRGIFLSAYPRSKIPDAFVLSAICLAAASLLASALAARLGPARLAQAILGGAAALLVAARLSLATGHAGAPMVVYVIVEVVAGLLLVQGWQVAAEALDVRSAKRILPIVGSGAGVAWLLGGFGVGALARRVGTAELLLVAPVLLAAALAVGEVIARRDHKRHLPRSAAGGMVGEIRDALRYVASEPLLRLVALLSIADLLIEQVIDYQLFAAAQVRYATHPEDIAAFMGKLYGVTGAATVIVPLILAGRLLSRFGSTRCLMAAQVWVLIGSALFFLFPGFALVVLISAGDRILKQSLSSPGRAQMQTPVPAVRRTQAGALVRGVLAPLCYAGGGAVLKLLPSDLGIRWVSLATIGLAVVLLVVSGRHLRLAYLRALHRSMDQRRLDLDEASPELDREHCMALREKVLSPDEAQAAFAVSLLGAGDPQVARPLLHEACGHPSSHVRAAAVEALAGFHHADDVAVVTETLERATEEEVERACLAALAHLEGRGCGDAVRRRADDADVRVRALARASLARAEEVGYGSLAWMGRTASGALAAVTHEAKAELALGGDPEPDSRLGRFLALLRSARPEERAAAAWAMGEVRLEHPTLRAAFASLFDDDAAPVRLGALRAAGRLGDRRLARRIVAALDGPDRAHLRAAYDAFAALDDVAVPAIEAALVGAAPQVLARTASALAPGRGRHGDALLARLLAHDHRVVRYRAARALAARRSSDGWQPPAHETVLAAVRRELATGYRYYAIIVGIARGDGVDDYQVEPRFAFLAGEVRARVRQTERRLLAILSLAGDPKLVEVAESRLRHHEPSDVARAVELLEHALDPRLAALVVPFLEPSPLRLRLKGSEQEFPVPPGCLEDPLAAIVELQDPYLRRCALTCFRDRIAAEYPHVLVEDDPVLPLVERIYFLRGVPLFRDLSGEDLMQVAEIAGRQELEGGTVIFKKGEPGDVLYIVARGRVEVKDGDHVIATLEKNEFFGELAILDGEARSADAVCAEKTELLSLFRADLDELVERRPEIAREIIRVLTRRIRESNLRLSRS